MKGLTTIASMPSGGGSKSAPAAEVGQKAPTVQMKAPYFREEPADPKPAFVVPIITALILKPEHIAYGGCVGQSSEFLAARRGKPNAVLVSSYADRFKYDERN